jgi:hypothetical protein
MNLPPEARLRAAAAELNLAAVEVEDGYLDPLLEAAQERLR